MSDLNINWLKENFLNKNITFFDIGCANLGDTMNFQVGLPDAKFYSFECCDQHKENNTRLASELGINYFHSAMTDQIGQSVYYPCATFNGFNHPDSGSLCKPNSTTISTGEFSWGEPYIVDTTTLSSFCDLHNVSPDIIHIDVQGAEYKVLSNMGAYRPVCIWAEICDFDSCYDTNTTYLQFNELMLSLGYVSIFNSGPDELYVLPGSNLTPYYPIK